MGKHNLKNTSRLGSIGELAVALDGVTKGYHVFPAFSSEGAIDIIFTKKHVVIKVQVKVGNRVKQGTKALRYCDALALVDDLNRVRYFTLSPWVCRQISPCQMLRTTRRKSKDSHVVTRKESSLSSRRRRTQDD